MLSSDDCSIFQGCLAGFESLETLSSSPSKKEFSGAKGEEDTAPLSGKGGH